MQHLTHAYESIEPSIPQELFTPIREADPRKLNGFATSPGIIEGPCAIIRDLQDLQALPCGTIAVFEAALPTVVPFMPSLGGLIAERGGTLSIASGYAREYRIPAVFGIEGLMDVIHNGDLIRVDGSRGTVDRIGQSGQGGIDRGCQSSAMFRRR